MRQANWWGVWCILGLISGLTFGLAVEPIRSIQAAEVVRLTPATWDTHAPAGKEVDAIYGDFVLRNDKVVAVIADPLPSRNANMTVRAVGGSVIDLTVRDAMNDQLSAYFPVSARIPFELAANLPKDHRESQPQVALTVKSPAKGKLPLIEVTYRLADGQPYLLIETKWTNTQSEAIDMELVDATRADRMFASGNDEATGLVWLYDDWFGQAYGVLAEDAQVAATGGKEKRAPTQLTYTIKGQAKIKLEPGQSHTLRRWLIPGSTLLEVQAIALRAKGIGLADLNSQVSDAAGPIAHAKVEIRQDSKRVGWGRTDAQGRLKASLPPGRYTVVATALGRPEVEQTLELSQAREVAITLETPGYVVAQITNVDNGPIPCKVQFLGKGDTKDPDFGPSAGEVGILNTYYSHTGKFRQELGPGKYSVILSYGPEYDAVFTEIEVARGKETKLSAQLKRTVNTKGWISTDFHNHSTPSGDNVSSTLGRVLNILCEQIDYAPCTEHNRIGSYLPQLKQLGCVHLLGTCSGMELTGQPLPVNHQNVFPLTLKEYTQDGGAPLTDINPEAQIERLALWEPTQEKLIQQNHPNIGQILGDRDDNGAPDVGLAKMFQFMDVIEVHPLNTIFDVPSAKPEDFKKRGGNTIFQWMQTLNMGLKIPGVVNTDSHYNFHESGFFRNYLPSKTDDPSKIQVLDVVHAAEQGQIVMTNGPFLEASITPQNSDRTRTVMSGETLHVSDGKIFLKVRVQCANWYDINRVQVFVNGRAEPKLNFTRKANPEMFKTGAVRFEQSIPFELQDDAHLIVATIGEGLVMGPVMGPTWGSEAPVAVSNPIYIDRQGDGFQPSGDLLDVPLPGSERWKK